MIVSNETIVKEWFHVKRSASGPSSFNLETFLPYRLSVTTNRVSRAFAAQYEQEFGISIPEWRAIAVLGDVRKSDLFPDDAVFDLLMTDQSDEEMLLFAERINPPEVLAKFREDLNVDEAGLARLRAEKWDW